jgi:hypothetical protein
MRKLFTVFMALVLSLTYSSPVLAQSATPVALGTVGNPTLVDGQSTSPRTDLFGRMYVNVNNIAQSVPLTAGWISAATPVSTTAVGSNLTTTTGQLLYINVTSGASAGYVMVFNTASAPADGAVTPTFCYVLAANSTLSTTYNAIAAPNFSTGITVVFSTTGCFTKTASATAFIAIAKG